MQQQAFKFAEFVIPAVSRFPTRTASCAVVHTEMEDGSRRAQSQRRRTQMHSRLS